MKHKYDIRYIFFQMESMDMLDWGSGCGTIGNFGAGTGNAFGNTSGTSGGESMMVDEDYMELMTDTLFSTISSNQPIYFPDPREIGNSFRDVPLPRRYLLVFLNFKNFLIIFDNRDRSETILLVEILRIL